MNNSKPMEDITMNPAELSVAREVLCFDHGMNPKWIAAYSPSAIARIIDLFEPGGLAGFQVNHAEAIAEMAETIAQTAEAADMNTSDGLGA